MSILPADKLILLKVGDVVVWLIGVQFENQPPDVRVKKTFRDIVRIIVMIDMLVMAAMFARPHQDRVFKSGCAKDQREQTDWPAGAESDVREKPMITNRDAEAARQKHDEEKRDLKPIETEMVEVERDGGER